MRQLSKVIVFFLCVSCSLYGQTLSVTLLDLEDGLSQSNVNDTLKGPYGYYWFATQDGLSRYDGYSFKQYKLQTFPVLKSNFFTRIVQYDERHLLLGTANGLYKLNVLTDALTAIKPAVLSGLVVTDIQVTSEQINLIAGDKVFALNLSFEPLKQQTNTILASSSRSLFSLNEQSYYLSGIGSIEPIFLEQKLPQALERFNNQLHPEALAFSQHKGQLWLGTPTGLWLVDSTESKQVLTGVEAKFLVWDKRNTLWLAGKDGIFWGKQNEVGEVRLHQVETGLAEGSSLPTDDLSSLYADEDYIWFGMVSKGVAFHAAKQKWFENYSTNTQDITLPSNDVLSILSDQTELWVATGNGLVHIENDQIQLYNQEKAPSFYSNRVTKVVKDNRGRLWLGFDQGGLVYRQIKSDKFIRQPLLDYSVFVKDFLLVKDTLYVATVAAGLFALDLVTGEVVHYHKNSDKGLLTNRIQSLQKGPKDSVLIGSFGKGILQFNSQSKSFTPIENIYKGLAGVFTDAIISDMQILAADLWITTTTGAYRYNIITEQLFHLDAPKGLPNELVYTVLPDGDQLWLPTNKGITYYDPKTGFITSYGKQEGLINNEYNANAFAQTEQGILWVGGVEGLTAINTKLRPDLDTYLAPKLTEVKLFNRALSTEQKQSILDSSSTAVSLNLPSNARMFSLYFSTFQAGLANAVKFRYKLEGFDEQWVVNESGVNFITYTNIGYGQYQLLVSASLDKQNWSSATPVTITIAPPKWLTTQAKVSYFIVVIGLLSLLIYLIWGKLKAEKETYLKTKASEQKLQFSMHTSGSILWELDLVNRQYHLVDYQADEKESKTGALTEEGLNQVLHPDDATKLLEMLQGSLSEKVFMKRQYLRFNHSQGFIWMKGNSVVSQRNKEGEAEQIIGVSYNVNELKRTQLALKELNVELESRVEDRTQKLNESNGELKKTLDNLRLAQEELIESQKMASLGAMVTGIAHEINTPLGVCVTGLSHMNNLVLDIKTKLESKSLTQSDLIHFLATCSESLDLLNKNVERSAELVKSFKQVSVDQTAEELTQFSLFKLVEDTIVTLEGELKRKNVEVTLGFQPELKLVSYAASLSQVIRNLTLNTITHGFTEHSAGKITISVVDLSQEDNEILLIFSDNGSGIAEESLNKVFDPFYTSKRSAGNTGLGLHITYNLVVQKLKGAITVNSLSNTGTEFYIRLPVDLSLNDTA